MERPDEPSLEWWCLQTEPGQFAEPAGLPSRDTDWLQAAVPGTAASAIRSARGTEECLAIDYDEFDWWFVTQFEVDRDREFLLASEGIATVSDIWIDSELLHHRDSMFQRFDTTLRLSAGTHRLTIRCEALAPLLKQKRPRPRWRSQLVPVRTLRWWRTTALGRMPGWAGFAAPVGPWRPITLTPRRDHGLVRRSVHTSVDSDGGLVVVDLEVTGELTGQPLLRVGDVTTRLAVSGADRGSRLTGELRVSEPQLWWPHTHGDAHLYDAKLELSDDEIDVGKVGFRTVTADRGDDGFALIINGERIFARGACWVPTDVISLNSSRREIFDVLTQVKHAGMNMVRVPGTMVYETPDFWDACDELGIMVWQDAMLTTMDPPDDPEWLEQFEAELREVCAPLAARPSIAVISGGSETLQQPTMMGLDSGSFPIPAIEVVAPRVVADELPGVPYVESSPSGSPLATHNGTGIAHYFGVGGYLRPLTDARRAHVRFAAECLAFSIPPAAETIDEEFGGPAGIASQQWRAGIPRDAGATWDFQDVQDFYVREIFGIDPTEVRADNPARALDLGRAAVSAAMVSTFSEWRRPGSDCAGGLVLALRDLVPGPGWGLLDSRGRPKAPLYALHRVLAPVALTITDEGLDGLALHLLNDPVRPIVGQLVVEVFDRNGNRSIAETHDVELPGRSQTTLAIDEILGAFRDINYAYRFGEQIYDVVRAELRYGEQTVGVTYVLDAPWRLAQRDIGLRAVAQQRDGEWVIDVETDEPAEWVSLDVQGFDLSDSWFHLAPGQRCSIIARPRVADQLLVGVVTALNCLGPSRIDVAEAT